MTSLDADPLLRRLERRALVFCVLAAAATLVLRGGRPEVALGVVGGGILIGVSYWAIRSSIDGILALALGGMPSAGLKPGGSEERERGSHPAAAEVSPDARAGARRSALVYGFRFVGRYAVLAALAYVMLVWLRLHPVGLIIGVSSIVVAAAIEAVSTMTRAPRAQG